MGRVGMRGSVVTPVADDAEIAGGVSDIEESRQTQIARSILPIFKTFRFRSCRDAG